MITHKKADGNNQHRLVSPSKTTIHLAFLAVIGLPMTINFFRLSSSVALGSAIAGLFITAVLFQHGIAITKIKKIAAASIGICLALLAHLLSASAFLNVDLGRGIGTIALALVFIYGAISLGEILKRCNPGDLESAINHCTQALLFIGLWGALGLPEPAYGGWNKPIFPFTEPSHLAVTFAPYLIFSCTTSPAAKKIAYISAALILTILLQSTTLAAIVFLTIPICLRLRYVAPTFLLIAPLLLSLDLTHYVNRLSLTDENNNLTALVYLQGWQLIEESIAKSYGFGIGFQQLGIFGTEAPASVLIATVLGDADAFLNIFDGGFTLAKILCELGIFGALALVAYSVSLARSAARINKHATSAKKTNLRIIFAYSCIIGFVFELALRGIGYFTPTIFLLVASTWLIHSEKH